MSTKQVKDWITVNGQHIPIFEGESKNDAVNRAIAKSNEDKKTADIKRNKEESDRLNKKSKSIVNGSTPKDLDDEAIYKISKTGSSDSDYGALPGSDVKAILKGFHYEELVPGDGMWCKDGSKHYYIVKKVEK